MEEKKRFKGKKVYIILKTHRVYSGKVIEEDNDGISLIDKFGKHIYISISEISSMEEEGEK